MFAEVSQVDQSFHAMKYDGLMGLGFRSMAKNKAPVPLDLMKRQGVISRRTFSFSLYGRAVGKKSQLLIGEPDTTLYKQPMHFIPLTEIGFWQFNVFRIIIGNIAELCPNGCQTILDSGTTLIAGPHGDVERLNKNVLRARNYRNSGTYLLRCSHIRTLPDITFVMQDQKGVSRPFRLSPQQYTRKVGLRKHCR